MKKRKTGDTVVDLKRNVQNQVVVTSTALQFVLPWLNVYELKQVRELNKEAFGLTLVTRTAPFQTIQLKSLQKVCLKVYVNFLKTYAFYPNLDQDVPDQVFGKMHKVFYAK